MPPGFSGNLIFAIIARMLCGNYLNRDFEDRKQLFIALVLNCSHLHAQTYPRKSSRLRPLRHRIFHNNYGLWFNLQGVNSLCVVVVSCCATDWSVDYVSIVISESKTTACRQEAWRYMFGWLLFLYCVWNTFFWVYRSVGFEENIMYAKNGIMSAT